MLVTRSVLVRDVNATKQTLLKYVNVPKHTYMYNQSFAVICLHLFNLGELMREMNLY